MAANGLISHFLNRFGGKELIPEGQLQVTTSEKCLLPARRCQAHNRGWGRFPVTHRLGHAGAISRRRVRAGSFLSPSSPVRKSHQPPP